MMQEWYTSVLKYYHDVPLTGLQVEILIRCVEIDPTVYDIKKNIERGIVESRESEYGPIRYMELPKKDEINYKLVHQGVKRLEKLGYIQKARTGYLERGKIPYRHTELGVFYLLHHHIGHLQSFYMGKENEDELPQTLRLFLHPYFEFGTIRNATTQLIIFFHEYLQQCCITAVNMLAYDYWRSSKKSDFSTDDRLAKAKAKLREREFLEDLQERLRTTAEAYLLKITMAEPFLVDPYNEATGKKSTVIEEINARDIAERKKTLQLLASDKRFTEALDAVFEDASKAHKKIIDLRKSM